MGGLRFGRWSFALQRIAGAQASGREVDGWAFRVLCQSVVLASIDAATAERALGRVVGPGEFLAGCIECDGAGCATEPAHGAAGTPRGIEVHQAAKAIGHGWSSG